MGQSKLAVAKKVRWFCRSGFRGVNGVVHAGGPDSRVS